jgi:hypothetical protein
MTNHPVVVSGLRTLRNILNRLGTDGEQNAKATAQSGIELVDSLLEVLGKKTESEKQPTSHSVRDGDATNYSMYKLLVEYGLSRRQLVEVIRTVESNEIQVLRILRNTYGLTLQEAQDVVASTVDTPGV